MSLDYYPNLRAFFHAPHPVPKPSIERDYRIARCFERAFPTSGYDPEAGPFRLQPDQTAPQKPFTENSNEWINTTPYNPFNKAIVFNQWFERYSDALGKVQDLEALYEIPWIRVFLPLLTESELTKLDQHLGTNHPCKDEIYDLAGAWDRIPLNDVVETTSNLTLNEGDDLRLQEHLGYRREHAHRMDLCRDFRELGLVGRSEGMVEFFQQVNEYCTGSGGHAHLLTDANVEQAAQVVLDGTVLHTYNVPPLAARQPDDIALWVVHVLSQQSPNNPLLAYRFPLALWCVELKEKEWRTPLGDKPDNELAALHTTILQIQGRFHPQRLQQAPAPRQPMADGTPSARHEEPTSNCVFREEQDGFTIRFDNQTQRLSNTKGMRYIAMLLDNPCRSFHAIELRNLIEKSEQKPNTQYNTMIAEQREEEGLPGRPSEAKGTIIDAQTVSELKKQLRILGDQREQATEEGNNILVDEIDRDSKAIQQHLKEETTPSGQLRTFPDKPKKDQVDVRANIRRALDKMKSHSSLWNHLNNSIKPGGNYTYSYSPPEPITWET
jgi:hypothetical protein